VPGWLKGHSSSAASRRRCRRTGVLFRAVQRERLVDPAIVVRSSDPLGAFLCAPRGMRCDRWPKTRPRRGLLEYPRRRSRRLVWVIEGLLAGMNGILSAPSRGITIGGGAPADRDSFRRGRRRSSPHGETAAGVGAAVGSHHDRAFRVKTCAYGSASRRRGQPGCHPVGSWPSRQKRSRARRRGQRRFGGGSEAASPKQCASPDRGHRRPDSASFAVVAVVIHRDPTWGPARYDARGKAAIIYGSSPSAPPRRPTGWSGKDEPRPCGSPVSGG